MSGRRPHALAQDANVNAVIILSTQGGMVPTYVEDSLAEMEHLFGAGCGKWCQTPCCTQESECLRPQSRRPAQGEGKEAQR